MKLTKEQLEEIGFVKEPDGFFYYKLNNDGDCLEIAPCGDFNLFIHTYPAQVYFNTIDELKQFIKAFKEQNNG